MKTYLLIIVLGWALSPIPIIAEEQAGPELPKAEELREEVPPGTYDLEILENLKDITKILPLKTTALKDVAPEFFVEAPANLTWEQALSTANKDYAEDRDKRALYLSKFLVKGAPVSRLGELNLREMGNNASTGGGRGVTLGLAIEEEEERTSDWPGLGSVKFKPIKARATFSFWCSHGEWIEVDGKRILDRGQSVLHGRPTLCIPDLKYRERVYKKLSFDHENRLSSFYFRSEPDKLGAVYEIGGNCSGKDGAEFYWASLRYKDQSKAAEVLSLSQLLGVTERTVADLKTGKTKYRDIYQNGRLAKRLYYKEIREAAGTQTVIDRVKEFESPPIDNR